MLGNNSSNAVYSAIKQYAQRLSNDSITRKIIGQNKPMEDIAYWAESEGLYDLAGLIQGFTTEQQGGSR